MTNALEVHVTAPSREQAAEIARKLVEERLAACVNIVGDMRSVYRWDGKIHEEEEVLCLVKTRPELLDALTERIRALHPYDVPEILAFEVADGSADYLAWLHESTLPAAALPSSGSSDAGK